MEGFSGGTINEIERMFPEKQGINYGCLKLTPEGSYSITRRNDGRRLLQKILSVTGPTEKMHITDATGSVGGDTILFALNFKRVESIEINKENFDALKHNTGIYNLTNVGLHNGDSTQIFDWKTDVLYIDPPWGGPKYKEKSNIDLHMGNVRLDIWITEIIKRASRPNFIFIKVPFNYNFERFDSISGVSAVHKFQIRNFFLIGLLFPKN